MSIKENGINSNTFDVLLGKDHFKIREKTKSSKEEALKMIELFTLLNDSDEEEILESGKSFIRRENVYFYIAGRRPYMFDRMDKHVNYRIKNVLRTKERYGVCCPESMKLAYDSEKDSNVIIGYIHYSEKKVIHAVYEEDGLIYDFTKNLVMMKEDYFDLTGFEVLNVISNDDIKSDYKYIHSFEIVPLKLYLIFRDEMMRDLKKNKKAFKKVMK